MSYYLDAPGLVRLGIYDVTGQRVASLADGIEGPGWHARIWNGLDRRGLRSKPGFFYARLEVHGETRTQKLTLVR